MLLSVGSPPPHAHPSPCPTMPCTFKSLYESFFLARAKKEFFGLSPLINSNLWSLNRPILGSFCPPRTVRGAFWAIFALFGPFETPTHKSFFCLNVFFPRARKKGFYIDKAPTLCSVLCFSSFYLLIVYHESHNVLLPS